MMLWLRSWRKLGADLAGRRRKAQGPTRPDPQPQGPAGLRCVLPSPGQCGRLDKLLRLEGSSPPGPGRRPVVAVAGTVMSGASVQGLLGEAASIGNGVHGGAWSDIANAVEDPAAGVAPDGGSAGRGHPTTSCIAGQLGMSAPASARLWLAFVAVLNPVECLPSYCTRAEQLKSSHSWTEQGDRSRALLVTRLLRKSVGTRPALFSWPPRW